MESVIVWSLVWVVLIIGLVGTIVPGLPGTGLIFLGILGHAWYFGFEEIGVTALVVLGVVALLSFVFDVLSTAYGAKHFGSTKAGMFGAILGGLLGAIVLNFPGLMLGIFLGAVASELVFAKKNMEQSLRAGTGSVIGFLGGTVLKFLLGIVMIGYFIFQIFF